MAARALRRYKASPSATGVWTAVQPAVVPASRALVVSKVIVSTTNPGGAVKFGLGTGSASGAPRAFTDAQFVAPGDEYVGGGMILIAGDQFEIFQYDGTANTVYIAVFGEEVDN